MSKMIIEGRGVFRFFQWRTLRRSHRGTWKGEKKRVRESAHWSIKEAEALTDTHIQLLKENYASSNIFNYAVKCKAGVWSRLDPLTS